MNDKNLKKAIYIVILILLLIFYAKDIDFFNNKFYEDIKIVQNPDDILVLVNKNNILKKDFVPKNLEVIDIKCSNADKKLRKIARIAFEDLCNDALILGYKIVAVSAYRDYEYQKKLYNEYVSLKGIDYADRASARPGHSEHQTGLAVDVMGSNNDYDNFEDSIEFDWMKNNAHKYGFILRYPNNKENITGFKYEPWHYRYVGVDVAKYLYENNITLEELKEKK